MYYCRQKVTRTDSNELAQKNLVLGPEKKIHPSRNASFHNDLLRSVLDQVFFNSSFFPQMARYDKFSKGWNNQFHFLGLDDAFLVPLTFIFQIWSGFETRPWNLEILQLMCHLCSFCCSQA